MNSNGYLEGHTADHNGCLEQQHRRRQGPPGVTAALRKHAVDDDGYLEEHAVDNNGHLAKQLHRRSAL